MRAQERAQRDMRCAAVMPEVDPDRRVPHGSESERGRAEVVQVGPVVRARPSGRDCWARKEGREKFYV